MEWLFYYKQRKYKNEGWGTSELPEPVTCSFFPQDFSRASRLNPREVLRALPKSTCKGRSLLGGVIVRIAYRFVQVQKYATGQSLAKQKAGRAENLEWIEIVKPFEGRE